MSPLRIPLLLALLLAAAPAAAQTNAYLDLDGIPGEATAPGFEDTIEVSFFADAFAMPGPGVEARPIVVRKGVDRSSPLLWLALAKGNLILDGTLTIRTASGTPVTLYEITLEGALINDMSQITGESGPSSELVSLWYQKITWEKDGLPVCWDRSIGKTC